MPDDREREINIANIVASGKLDVELDLASVAEDLSGQDGIESVEHSRRSGNRLLIRFNEFDTLGILSPTGVYVFTGADSESEVYQLKDVLLSGLSSLGIISEREPPDEEIIDSFEIQNFVFTTDFERELNLNALAIGLGLENTEYEPEQFPGLVYRPSIGSCTILIFASGKIVITGVNSEDITMKEIEKLSNKVEYILN